MHVDNFYWQKFPFMSADMIKSLSHIAADNFQIITSLYASWRAGNNLQGVILINQSPSHVKFLI
jgi:hypothetical protein